MTIRIVHTFADIAVRSFSQRLHLRVLELLVSLLLLIPCSCYECYIMLAPVYWILKWIHVCTFQVLLGLFVLGSAYIATLIFRDAISEYEDYRTALLNLFVLLTTANNPNVWADAYTADRRAFFFFFTYLVVGLFFLMNLVFTVIYSNYKAQVWRVGCKSLGCCLFELKFPFIFPAEVAFFE